MSKEAKSLVQKLGIRTAESELLLFNFLAVDRIFTTGVNFQVDQEERVGLLSGNGAGKATLLKIVTDELTPDAGNANILKGMKLGYVAQLNHYPPGTACEDVLHAAFSRNRYVGQRIHNGTRSSML